MLGLLLITTTRFEDHRGFFAEIYSSRKYSELGINAQFPQENHSVSGEVGTLRGLHFQAPPMAQGKLVRCGRGAIFDVAIDIRKGSPTYGSWEGYKLSAENGHQLFIPPGFAHGFVTLEPDTEIIYKCTEYYSKEAEGALAWNDQDIAIEWALTCEPILSDKDRNAPFLRSFDSPFHYDENS